MASRTVDPGLMELGVLFGIDGSAPPFRALRQRRDLHCGRSFGRLELLSAGLNAGNGAVLFGRPIGSPT